MADQDQDFEQWVADHGGPEAVAATIEDLKRRAADGTLPAFRNNDELLAHWVAGRSQTV